MPTNDLKPLTLDQLTIRQLQEANCNKVVVAFNNLEDNELEVFIDNPCGVLGLVAKERFIKHATGLLHHNTSGYITYYIDKNLIHLDVENNTTLIEQFFYTHNGNLYEGLELTEYIDKTISRISMLTDNLQNLLREAKGTKDKQALLDIITNCHEELKYF